MGVTSYYSFGGEIIGEETGGVRRDYLTDALGSVTATVTGAGVVENTYRYKPYGEQLAKTGTGSDPRFLWTGSGGSASSKKNFAYNYNRYRHYDYKTSLWISFDPIPDIYINRWNYCLGNPTTKTDPYGLSPCGDDEKPCCNPKSIYHYLVSVNSHCKNGYWKDCGKGNILGNYKSDCEKRLKNMDKTKMCKAAKDLIIERIGICNDFGSGGSYDRNAPWAATQMCCFDQKLKKHVNCGVFCCSGNMGKDPCFSYCVIKHEQRHGRDCEATGTWPEVCAYRVEVECHFNIYKKVCGWRSLSDFPGWGQCAATSKSKCQGFK